MNQPEIDIISWLLDGDPAIRWQTQRDLLDAGDWQAEREQTLENGWGAQLLARQDADGSWGGGIYSPKWISTTYTLLTLCEIGIPGGCEPARRGAWRVLDKRLGERCDEPFAQKLAEDDRCIVGMVLQLAVYFGIQDERVPAIVDNLLAEIMPDTGWNCRKQRKPLPYHSSFHTTLNVLDGLREYLERGDPYRREEIQAAEAGALELLLQHRLIYSDHTGEVIKPQFARISFPHHWHYDMLRALDYFARANAPRDPRLAEAIALLREKQGSDGLWKVEHQYSGKVYFHMERVGKPSRWNTLRALRILKWWEG